MSKIDTIILIAVGVAIVCGGCLWIIERYIDLEKRVDRLEKDKNDREKS